MDIGEIRHRNFQALIASLERAGATTRAAQGARLGGFLSASYVSQLLGGKYMGDEVARKISEALGHERGWMDRPQWPDEGAASIPISPIATNEGYVRVDQIDATGGMGGAVINDDHPEIIRSVEYGEAYIRALIGFVPPPGRLKLVSGAGDSMRPLIEPGEPTLMDSGVTTFRGDGIYWIGLGDRDDGHQIKMLQQRGDGLWVVSANPLYPPFPFPPNGRIGGQLYIRHRIERFN
ncbi:S24 family peptidase [Stenotrophomonas acidaminiphila]|jgi:phage repressor protein C with HTH and peptisase S24 domain|uniref:S24 family peptidase n=1 Tax=Stenotrophomonas acidaminiphila TaxID=128780 RepID=UPI0024AC9087|nr:S24 family peptidase [Stenotrophomonas acidaminiphila]WHL17661.1 S24 family peptidase [Stenotrophomonas acidaminiphila]